MVRVAVPIMLEVVADCSDEERQLILRSQDALDGGGAQHLSDTGQRILWFTIKSWFTVTL